MEDKKRLNWTKLLYNEIRESEMPFTQENDDRSDFKKDYDTICFSSCFRRLQDKAQVFPLEQGDFVRTRLTHSIEVMSIVESLGEGACKTIIKKEPEINVKANDITMILRSAALIHDLGNPPFGHLSEKIIREWFKENLSKYYYSSVTNSIYKDESSSKEHSDSLKSILGEKATDFTEYDGNAQSFRIVNRLQTTSSNSGSMKLSYPLLATIIKYPYDTLNNRYWSGKTKKSFFNSERVIYENMQKKLELNYKRHPLVYLLEAADDIAYLTVDLEDASRKGLINVKDFVYELNEFIKTKKTSKNTSYAYNALLKYRNDIIAVLLSKKNISTDLENEIKNILSFSSKNKYKCPEDNLLGIHKIIIHTKGVLISYVKDIFELKYDSIVFGKEQQSLLGLRESKYIEEFLRNLLVKKVYYCDIIINNKIYGQKVIVKLLDVLIPSVLNDNMHNPDDNSSYLNSRLLSNNFYNVCAKELGLEYRDKNERKIKKIYLFQILFILRF
jgi:dGTPase